MILRCSFEELSALTSSAGRLLDAHDEGGRVSAPAGVMATLELLLPELTGDLSIGTLAEQQRLDDALELALADAPQRMDRLVIEPQPAADYAATAYFAYA